MKVFLFANMPRQLRDNDDGLSLVKLQDARCFCYCTSVNIRMTSLTMWSTQPNLFVCIIMWYQKMKSNGKKVVDSLWQRSFAQSPAVRGSKEASWTKLSLGFHGGLLPLLLIRSHITQDKHGTQQRGERSFRLSISRHFCSWKSDVCKWDQNCD